MTRGPYYPSRMEFIDCACETLEMGEVYTYNEARKICRMSYCTVHDYVTVNLPDVNVGLGQECRRIIKGEEIQRSLPGFKVTRALNATAEAISDSEPCQVELSEEPGRKMGFPSDPFARYSPLNGKDSI